MTDDESTDDLREQLHAIAAHVREIKQEIDAAYIELMNYEEAWSGFHYREEEWTALHFEA